MREKVALRDIKNIQKMAADGRTASEISDILQIANARVATFMLPSEPKASIEIPADAPINGPAKVAGIPKRRRGRPLGKRS